MPRGTYMRFGHCGVKARDEVIGNIKTELEISLLGVESFCIDLGMAYYFDPVSSRLVLRC